MDKMEGRNRSEGTMRLLRYRTPRELAQEFARRMNEAKLNKVQLSPGIVLLNVAAESTVGDVNARDNKREAIERAFIEMVADVIDATPKDEGNDELAEAEAAVQSVAAIEDSALLRGYARAAMKFRDKREEEKKAAEQRAMIKKAAATFFPGAKDGRNGPAYPRHTRPLPRADIDG